MEDVDKVRKMHGNTEFKLVTCKSCGANFATEKELEYIKEKIDLPKELFELCEVCRRQELRCQIKELVKK